MSTIHLHQTTTSTPEQYVAGLTDFGPGRSKLFGNSAHEYLKVHDRGPSQADVTESLELGEGCFFDYEKQRVVKSVELLPPHSHPIPDPGEQFRAMSERKHLYEIILPPKGSVSVISLKSLSLAAY
jgi:hypothetical protein